MFGFGFVENIGEYDYLNSIVWCINLLICKMGLVDIMVDVVVGLGSELVSRWVGVFGWGWVFRLGLVFRLVLWLR